MAKGIPEAELEIIFNSCLPRMLKNENVTNRISPKSGIPQNAKRVSGMRLRQSRLSAGVRIMGT
jgi:hypothetical protein